MKIALGIVREPMFGLLLAGGLIYLALGDLTEAVVLSVFATISVSIAVVQESRTERVMQALRDLTSPRALVVRNGRRQRIPGREVVRGDRVILSEGDRVPADALLAEAQDLQADESLLTGESVPVRKRADAPVPEPLRPGGDDLPAVFSGTLVVRGRGTAVVTATGPRTELGKIGRSLQDIESAPPRLAAQTRRLVHVCAVAGLAVSLAAILLYGLLRGSWLDGLLAGVALGMSMLPEEFPLVLTVFTVMGAWRISRARVLTRRGATIETLGAATVLCTDKTGTLTENRMSVAELRAGDTHHRPDTDAAPVPPRLHELVETAALASAPEPFDPMERALQQLARTQAPGGGRELVREFGLSPDLLAVTYVWRVEGGAGLVAATKGAPEAVADLCRLERAERAQLAHVVEAMAGEGMRVLAVGRAELEAAEAPSTPRDIAFRYLGLIGFADPLRAAVPDAVRECRSAGVKVVMITGDYPVTALAIARQAGLAGGDAKAVAGEELERASDADLADRLREASVFARIMPQQKLRIVTALQARGEVVAMTGDGVNDAPSLKAADIGIAMGGRGTDVAREAAAIVLLDDDFGSIVRTLRLGRRIYDNLRKAMGYILAVHVPIAGLGLLPLLLGLPMILTPIHIAFLEMVIDPVCSVVFEAEREEDDIMRRPPRPPQSPLIPLALVGWSLWQGVLAFAVVAAVFLGAVLRGLPEAEVRALAFVTLVLVNLGLVLVNRSFGASSIAVLRRPNSALLWVFGTALVILAVAIAWPPAGALFRFGPLHLHDLAVSAAAAVGMLALLDLTKPFWHVRLQR